MRCPGAGCCSCGPSFSDCSLRRRSTISVSVLKRHHPFHESDHILSLVYNFLTGGRTIEDVQRRRTDLEYLDAAGTQRIPGATTAGDFLRRFENRTFLICRERISRSANGHGRGSEARIRRSSISTVPSWRSQASAEKGLIWLTTASGVTALCSSVSRIPRRCSGSRTVLLLAPLT